VDEEVVVDDGSGSIVKVTEISCPLLVAPTPKTVIVAE
jgi:hypothetical protein